MFPIDTAPCARLWAAFLGNHWADAPERALAARLEEMAPGCGALVRRAREFHRRVAMWSLGRGCGGGVICGAGLPAQPEVYRSSSGRVLPGRWFLVDPDERITVVNRWLPGSDPSGRVSAAQGTALDPAGILACPEMREITPPLSAQVQLGAQFWEPAAAAEAVAAWGRLLPDGSVFAMSLWLPDLSSDAGREWIAAVDGVSAPVYAHSEADVLGWFSAPRLTVEEFTVRRCRAGAVAVVAAAIG